MIQNSSGRKCEHIAERMDGWMDAIPGCHGVSATARRGSLPGWVAIYNFLHFFVLCDPRIRHPFQSSAIGGHTMAAQCPEKFISVRGPV